MRKSTATELFCKMMCGAIKVYNSPYCMEHSIQLEKVVGLIEKEHGRCEHKEWRVKAGMYVDLYICLGCGKEEREHERTK